MKLNEIEKSQVRACNLSSQMELLNSDEYI